MAGFGTLWQEVAPHLIWVLVASPAIVGMIPLARRIHRERQRPPEEALVDYMAAGEIVNLYIDPDHSMGHRRIAVRAQVLARFEKIGGAKVGDRYNEQLLYQWLQVNAARALVRHQDEMA